MNNISRKIAHRSDQIWFMSDVGTNTFIRPAIHFPDVCHVSRLNKVAHTFFSLATLSSSCGILVHFKVIWVMTNFCTLSLQFHSALRFCRTPTGITQALPSDSAPSSPVQRLHHCWTYISIQVLPVTVPFSLTSRASLRSFFATGSTLWLIRE